MAGCDMSDRLPTNLVNPGHPGHLRIFVPMKFPLHLVVLVWSCAPSAPEAGFSQADDSAIRAAMAAQEMAWDRADIDGFMQPYADAVCFLSPKGRICGRAAVTANYRRSYPDAAAMGDLAFDVTEVVPAGTDHAWVTGEWRLSRSDDTLSGAFSLLWQRQAKGWRITRDHTH
jgi:ketosteroid isomerase-like protein